MVRGTTQRTEIYDEIAPIRVFGPSLVKFGQLRYLTDFDEKVGQLLYNPLLYPGRDCLVVIEYSERV